MLTEENSVTSKFKSQYMIIFTSMAISVLYSILRNKMILIFFSPSFYYTVPLKLFSAFFFSSILLV